MAKEEYGYGRPLWQWILIYIVIGIIVYGLIYYFVLGNRGSGGLYQFNDANVPTQSNMPTISSEDPVIRY